MNACICAGSVILISASTSVSLTSIALFTNAILASSIVLGIPGCTFSLSMITPDTNFDSSIEAPSLDSIFICSVSTFPSSTTCCTAPTMSSANGSLAFSEPLPVIAVIATFINVSLSDMSMDNPSKISCAFSAACL